MANKDGTSNIACDLISRLNSLNQRNNDLLLKECKAKAKIEEIWHDYQAALHDHHKIESEREETVYAITQLLQQSIEHPKVQKQYKQRPNRATGPVNHKFVGMKIHIRIYIRYT
ncbi:MAG: hypothetical protein GY941_04390 [Planctomycetes bacterium]|nr:hypothetical protein [Planctomycetota bacterium]